MGIILGLMNWSQHGVKITHLVSKHTLAEKAKAFLGMPQHKVWVDFDPRGYDRYKDEIEDWLRERGVEIGEWYDPASAHSFYAYLTENQAFEFRMRFG